MRPSALVGFNDESFVVLQEMNIISVKGICTGYLMDVELNRCVIVK